MSINASEPEAMVQRLKLGRGFAASYRPSVLANEDRIITALAQLNYKLAWSGGWLIAVPPQNTSRT